MFYKCMWRNSPKQWEKDAPLHMGKGKTYEDNSSVSQFYMLCTNTWGKFVPLELKSKAKMYSTTFLQNPSFSPNTAKPFWNVMEKTQLCWLIGSNVAFPSTQTFSVASFSASSSLFAVANLSAANLSSSARAPRSLHGIGLHTELYILSFYITIRVYWYCCWRFFFPNFINDFQFNPLVLSLIVKSPF